MKAYVVTEVLVDENTMRICHTVLKTTRNKEEARVFFENEVELLTGRRPDPETNESNYYYKLAELHSLIKITEMEVE